jgi:hypothetical protein
MVLILLVIAALVLWGVLASVLKLKDDGYGRPEIRDRNRGPEAFSTGRGQLIG